MQLETRDLNVKLHGSTDELLIDAVWMRQRCFIAGDKNSENTQICGTIYETKTRLHSRSISMTAGQFLLWSAIPFVCATIAFGRFKGETSLLRLGRRRNGTTH